MSKPVVVTRPLAQAETLAQQVAALGRTSIIFPLLDIQALADTSEVCDVLAHLERFALVAFVSPNAIDAAMAIRSDWPRGLSIAVIGEGSRKRLEKYSINDATARIIAPLDKQRTDSQTLLAALDVAALRNKEVLIIRGESGREFLAEALRTAGAKVTQVAAYRRCAPLFDTDRQKQLTQLLNESCDWIVTSSEALRNLAQMASQLGLVAKMQQQQLFVPHARIAETANSLGCRHVILTSSGDENMLAALQSHA